MSAFGNERLPEETLGVRDDLPGLEGVLVAFVLAAALLVALVFVG
jgi:hypothetical protein